MITETQTIVEWREAKQNHRLWYRITADQYKTEGDCGMAEGLPKGNCMAVGVHRNQK